MPRFLTSHRAALAVLGVTVLIHGACSSSTTTNSATASATKPPPAQATAAAGRPAVSVTQAARPSGTAASASTPDPQTLAAAQTLTPALIQTAELPQAERGFPQSGIIPVSNVEYGRNQPNAADVQSRLDKDGRIGGVTTGWSPVGQYSPGQKVITSVLDLLSEFQAADGARDGLALVFSQIDTQPAGSGANGQAKSTPLDVGTLGDETRAYRVETNYNAATTNASGTPTTDAVKQVLYVAGWRRGKVVAVVTISALNQDPPTDDLKQIVTLQDQKLQAAGF